MAAISFKSVRDPQVRKHRCKLSLSISDGQVVLDIIPVSAPLLHTSNRSGRRSLELQRFAKRRDSRPILAHRIQQLISRLSFHVFVSGFVEGRSERVAGGQLDTLASLTIAPDLWIEKGAECGKTGTDDCYIHLYDRPDAGLDIRPW